MPKKALIIVDMLNDFVDEKAHSIVAIQRD